MLHLHYRIVTENIRTQKQLTIVNFLEGNPTIVLVPFCFSFSFWLSSFHFFFRSSGWGEWTDWGDCDEEGLQHRTRRCGEDQEAEASLCQGNITQSRPCQPHEVPGKHMFLLANCWNKYAARNKLLWTDADISWKNPVHHTKV